MLEPPSETSRRWAFAIALLILLGLFTAEIVRDFEPVKLSALFFVLAWIPLLVVHEFGHALVARWLGYAVERVVFGFGRTLWSFPFAGTEVEVRAIPMEGFVSMLPRRRRGGARWRQAVVYFAGPGAEIAVGLALVAIFSWESLLTRSESVPILAAQATCLRVLFGVGFNLLPHSAGGKVSDGLGILRALFGGRGD